MKKYRQIRYPNLVAEYTQYGPIKNSHKKNQHSDFEKKNKEPALRILDLKNRFTFKERLSIKISGLKERLKNFLNLETFETLETFKNIFFFISFVFILECKTEFPMTGEAQCLRSSLSNSTVQ